MNDRLSRGVAWLLAHPAGFLVFNGFTAAWFTATFLIPRIFHAATLPVFVISLAGYLDVVTWMGGATQFTLAYQNQKAERALALTLRNQADTMRLLLQLAERDAQTGERLQEAVTEIDAEVDKMLAVAVASRDLHRKNADLIEQLALRNRTILEAALEAASRNVTPSG